MKKQLLAMTLMGVVLLTFAQSGKKPAKTFKSPRLISVQSNQTDQDPKSLIRTQLSLSSSDDLKLQGTVEDQLGFTHQKYQITYEGYEVFGSTYTAHLKDGKVSHITGNYAKVENVDLQATIPEKKALEIAKNGIEASKFIWDEEPSKTPKAKMVILDAATTGNEARLTYQFEVISLKPYQRYDVFIDAKTGEELMKYSKIHFADAVGTAATRYSGSQTIHTDSYTNGYRLRDYTRGNGVLSFDATTATSVNNSTGVPVGASDYTDNDNNWTSSEFDNADKDNAGLDAHFGASATYDFFYSTFGRDSYDGSGAAINSYVNTNIVSLYGYSSNDNAFWNGYAMVYAKGSSYNPLTTVDITGHEIGHAFMEYTAGMVYQKESGAMNESFSDIWGTCVENFTNVNYGTSKDLWNLGSEIGATFRSMSNPNAHSQPDTYGGTYWVNVTSCSPSGSNDYCGVHTNSGVGNHWFYILTVGKSGTNDNGDSYSVTGIGIDKAAAITWRSESVYLSSNSDYADWRTYAIQSAKDLYGGDSDEVIAVTNAWYAVGVGSAYGPIQCVSSPLTLSITFDNYPEETSWTVKNSSGSTVASGGTYGSEPDGSTITESISLAEGDYTFTINDSYGDGICCSYGSGSYTLSSGSTTIVTGGSFSSSKSTDFCISGSSSTDTEAPTAPSNLSASSVTVSSLTLSWDASTDNVGVSDYNVYQDGSLITSVSGTSTSTGISGLSASTTYSFQISAEDAAGNTSALSSALDVTTDTDTATISYCSSSGNSVSYEWIDLVQLGSIDNSTGANGGYGDFTSQSTTLVPGSSYTISFSAGFSGSTYNENWAIWVDYNHDGDFDDSGEQIVSGSTTNGNTYSATFTVPSSASLTSTRMRVSMVYGATPSSCGTSTYGEVEDYTVNISTASFNSFGITSSGAEPGEQLNELIATSAFMVYPDPVADIVNFTMGDFKNASIARIIDMGGKVIRTISVADQRALNISDLKPGLYLFELETERGSFQTRFIKQ